MTSPSATRAREPIGKRTLDLALSALMLLVSAPIWLAISAAIKLEDRGPVLYTQRRWGRDGATFRCYKFRTMVADSDARYGVIGAGEEDHRVTRVGRFLRTMGLDELPQLLNIFCGDMSFVGPRPLAVGEIVYDRERMIAYEEIPGFAERLSVRPGLTGLATIFIPKDSAPSMKFEYDVRYVRTLSFWGDVRLILLSFWISFRGRWESRQPKV